MAGISGPPMPYSRALRPTRHERGPGRGCRSRPPVQTRYRSPCGWRRSRSRNGTGVRTGPTVSSRATNMSAVTFGSTTVGSKERAAEGVALAAKHDARALGCWRPRGAAPPFGERLGIDQAGPGRWGPLSPSPTRSCCHGVHQLSRKTASYTGGLAPAGDWRHTHVCPVLRYLLAIAPRHRGSQIGVLEHDERRIAGRASRDFSFFTVPAHWRHEFLAQRGGAGER